MSFRFKQATAGTLLITNSTGASNLLVSGNNASRVFYLDSGANLTINGITITKGNGVGAASSGYGGGIFNNGGALTLINSIVSGNSANYGGSIYGYSDSTTTITNSTVSGNSASIYGGGILNTGTTTLTNSTVSGNTGTYDGGIYSEGTLNLTSVTVTKNNSTSSTCTDCAGGIYNSGGTANLKNTIVAGNTSAKASAPPDFSGAVAAGSAFNLIGSGTGMSGISNNDADHNQVGVDARLDPTLQLNGGTTANHALLYGSPALDKGNDASGTDQRGFARPKDLPDATYPNSGNGADIGAYEAQTDPSAPTYEADVQNRPNGDGFIDSDDVQQIRRFSVGLDKPYQSNEGQRADCSPRSSLGDGFVDSDDVEQARRYSVGLDAKQLAGGASNITAPELAKITNILGIKSDSDQPEAGRAVRVVNQTTSAAQTVVVPINVDTTGDETGYTFTLSYDSIKLNNPVISIGTAGGDVIANTSIDREIGFSISSFANQNGTIVAGTDLNLVTVTFTVAENAAGTSNLSFTDTLARRKVSGTDPDMLISQPIFTNGTIDISNLTVLGNRNNQRNRKHK